ncbi:hypothetical protein V6N13_091111 [Hibiscus sabdariffa]
MDEAINAPVGEPCFFGGESVVSAPESECHRRVQDLAEDRIVETFHVVQNNFEPCGSLQNFSGVKLQKKDEKRGSRSRKQSRDMLPVTRVDLDKWGRWKRSSRVQKRVTEKRKTGVTEKQPSDVVMPNIPDSEKENTFRAAEKSKTWVDIVAEAEATLDLGNKMGVSFHAPSSEVLKRLQQLEVEEGV